MIFRAVVLLVLAWAALAESWQGVDRVVAVGDVHGSYDQFTLVLKQAGVIDDKNKWTGGKTHLVQLGDVPDRGPDTRRIMDLLMNLEKQARKAGGMVHPLIGNHEAMNIYGDLRYTVPEEFAAFRNSNSEQVRVAFWEQHVQQELKGKATPEYKQDWEKKYPHGFFEHRLEFGPNGKYGKWIREHNAVIRIDDTLFLHGGLSPKYASVPLKDLNKSVRKELDDVKLIEGGTAIDPEGPLWYRGLANGVEELLIEHVDALLKFHGVKRIVVGHTPTDGSIVSRFGGKVILADVGLSPVYGARLACLVIEKGQPVALQRGVRQQLSVRAAAAE